MMKQFCVAVIKSPQVRGSVPGHIDQPGAHSKLL